MKRGVGIVIILIAGVVMYQLGDRPHPKGAPTQLTQAALQSVADGAGSIPVREAIGDEAGTLCVITPYQTPATLRGPREVVAMAEQSLDIGPGGMPEGEIGLFWSDGSTGWLVRHGSNRIVYSPELSLIPGDCVDAATGVLVVRAEDGRLLIGLQPGI